MAEHRRKNLISRPQCRIDLCSCGVYHVSMGAMTMRMQREQLEALFEAMGQALAPALAADEEPPVH